LPDRVEFGAVLDPKFRQDLRSWIETDRRVALRILDLMEAILRDPFAGIGKPEPLKYIGWCIASLISTCTSFKQNTTTDDNHSYLNASIGSSLAALIAGNIPLTIPTKPRIAVDQARIAESIFR